MYTVFTEHSEQIVGGLVIRIYYWGGDSPSALASVLCIGLMFPINCQMPTKAARTPFPQFCTLCPPM